MTLINKGGIANKEKRYELSEHLIESKMLIGKTKSQVSQLLSEEENTVDEDRWDYYLGYKPGFSKCPDMLSVHFKNNKVIYVNQ